MYKAKAIIPKASELVSASDMLYAISSALDKVANLAKDRFEETVETWEEKPEFEIIEESVYSRSVFTTNRIYFFLNNGTRVRYATMTPDFTPKTTPRVIRSGAGSGGVHYINKMRPRPGIEARQWDEVIAKEMREEFPKIAQQEINKRIART